MRVNTHKSKVEEVLNHFKNELHLEVSVDDHIPELLLLPPRTDLHSDDYFLRGAAILQVIHHSHSIQTTI